MPQLTADDILECITAYETGATREQSDPRIDEMLITLGDSVQVCVLDFEQKSRGTKAT